MFVAMRWRSSLSKYPPSVVQSAAARSARARGSSFTPGFTGPADRDSPSTIVVTPCRTMLSDRGSLRIV